MSDRAARRGFGTVRRAIRFAFRRVLGIYFREVEIGGDVPRPGTVGRIFAANHVNALVDPILVLTQAPCPISPVAKSMEAARERVGDGSRAGASAHPARA